MPRTTREWSQRKLDMAIGNLDNAGRHLHEVDDTYRVHHPEISNQLEAAKSAILSTIDFLDRLKSSY